MILTVTVDVEAFAFFNTVTDNFVTINGYQAFSNADELGEALTCDGDNLPRDTDDLMQRARAWETEHERRFVLAFHVNAIGEVTRGPFTWNDAVTERALLLNTAESAYTWELGIKIRDTLTGEEW